AQRGVRVVVHREELVVAEERDVLRDGLVAAQLVLLRTRRDVQRRQAAIALLFELSRGVRPRALALEQRHLIVPRERHEVHVLEAPRVVLLADAGRTRLRGRLLLEPRDELRGRLAGPAYRVLPLAARS